MTMPPLIRKGYVETRHGQMHVRVPVAEPAAGDAVIFLHRTPVTSASFDRVLGILAGWRPVLAFDTPGFGESFTPPVDFGMDLFVDAFAEAIARLGHRRFHLVGHHTGAHFAAELAARRDLGAQSLMIDGAMILTAAERAAPPPPAAAPVIDRDGGYASAAWTFIQPYHPDFDPRLVHEEFAGAMRSLFTRAACMNVVRRHDMGDALARVACPILASAASDDVFEPHLDRVLASAPGARVRRYGPAGIAAPERQPEAFCALVREAVALAEDGAGD